MVDGPAITPLRAAIIGLGNIAWRYDSDAPERTLSHRSTYAREPRTDLTIGHDADAAQRQRFSDGTGVATAASLDELLAMRPDIVSICSPNALHAEHLLACLEAEIPMIWLEKPATTRAADARALIALQKARGKSTVLVGFQRRYQTAYQRLRDLVRDRSLGALAGISITYSRGLETNGVHLVDVLFMLLGDDPPYELRGVTANGASPSFILQFLNGLPCAVTGLALDHHSIDITAHFSAGRAAVLYGGAVEIRERTTENPLFPGAYRLAPDVAAALDPAILEKSARGVFPLMLSDLIAAHAEGREPLSSLTTSLAAQEVVERVLEEAAR